MVAIFSRPQYADMIGKLLIENLIPWRFRCHYCSIVYDCMEREECNHYIAAIEIQTGHAYE